jgi:hypothetical protein
MDDLTFISRAALRAACQSFEVGKNLQNQRKGTSHEGGANRLPAAFARH